MVLSLCRTRSIKKMRTTEIEIVYAGSKHVSRFGEFDVLRAFLCWWVVTTHIVWCSAYQVDTLPRLVRLAAQGEYALDVFFILSGFVIAKVVAEKHETYGVFILRRFMRLFPAFFVTVFFAILLRPFIWSILAARWAPSMGELSGDSAVWASETNYSWAHIMAHLSMFHGLIPQAILPYSARAFLPTAWFVSIQWQFYLVAPLLIFIGRRFGPSGWFALIGGSILILAGFNPIMEVLFPIRSFLPQKLPLFLAGMLCYWIFIEIAGKHRNLPWLLFILAPALYVFSIPAAIWTAAFALVISDTEARGLAQIKAAFTLPWLRRLGVISYSTYLVHFCVIWLVKACILRFAPQASRLEMIVGLFAFVIPMTYSASEALFRFVEEPGIQVGKWLTGLRHDIVVPPASRFA